MADPDGKTTRLTGSVTLYVKPEDLPALDVASRETIRLVLRGSGDRKRELAAARDSIARSLEGLFSGWKSMAQDRPVSNVLAAAPPIISSPALLKPLPTHTVEIYHGADIERVTFGGPRLTERLSGSRTARSKLE